MDYYSSGFPATYFQLNNLKSENPTETQIENAYPWWHILISTPVHTFLKVVGEALLKGSTPTKAVNRKTPLKHY